MAKGRDYFTRIGITKKRQKRNGRILYFITTILIIDNVTLLK